MIPSAAISRQIRVVVPKRLVIHVLALVRDAGSNPLAACSDVDSVAIRDAGWNQPVILVQVPLVRDVESLRHATLVPALASRRAVGPRCWTCSAAVTRS